MADGEAAVLEAPSAPETAPQSDAIEVTEGYQRWDFPNPDAKTGDTAPAQQTVTEPAPVEAKEPEAPAPEASPDEDEIERILKSPAAKARYDRLVQNEYGTQLQRERQAAEQRGKELARQELVAEQKRWDEATATYNRLMDPDNSAFYEEMVRQNGEAEVLSFRANYQKAAAARQTAQQAPAFDATAYQRQFTEQFNHSAIGEFQNVVKATLPMYGELPEEVRQRVEAVRYDPNGNWLADAMTALGKGFETHIASLQRKHDAALREAVEAGKNEAVAAREESTPLTMTGEPGDMMSWQEIETMYAEGRLPGGREAFQQARRKFGKTD